MAPPSAQGTDNTSALLSLPQFRRSRRGSLASLASTSQVDKEAISQALDHIHGSASQSESLTTFNEYTSPPSSSSGTNKGLAAELQGGISSFYSRIKASVGNVRDKVPLTGDENIEETASSDSLYRSSPGGSLHSAAPRSHHSSPLAIVKAEGPIPHEVPHDKPKEVLSTHSRNESRSSKLSSSRGATRTGLPWIEDQDNVLPSPLHSATPPLTAAPSVAQIAVDTFSTHSLNPSPQNVAPENGFSSDQVSADVSQSKRLLSKCVAKYDLPENKGSTKLPATVAPPRDPDSVSSASSWSGRQVIVPSVQLKADDDLPPQQTEVDTVLPYSGVSPGISGSAKVPSEPRTVDLDVMNGNLAVGSIQSENGKTDIDSAEVDEKHMKGLDHHQDRKTTRHTTAKDIGASSHRHKDQQHLRNDSYKARAPPIPPLHSQSWVEPRSKILDKEFWMRDENARDCFYCGEPFSTFRRKHHCRLCGQIFDNKCTSLVPGSRLGQANSVRVCKQCESIMDTNDDSSDFSETDSVISSRTRTRHGSAGMSELLGSTDQRSTKLNNAATRSIIQHADRSKPTMSLPATRKTGGESSRKPVVLELGNTRSLLRPSSSRSLKSALSSRTPMLGHRRTNSRHLAQASSKKNSQEIAPFHHGSPEAKGIRDRLSAFHDDNIIDPDLAPYISDDSSGEEQVSIAAALHGSSTPRVSENDKSGLSGVLSASRKSKYRLGEKSISGFTHASRDADNVSLSSVRTGGPSRMHRRRNLSVAGNLNLRPSPRHYGGSTLNEVTRHPHFEVEHDLEPDPTSIKNTDDCGNGPRMMRSSSMKGSAAPAIELNPASLQHVRKLMRQFLQDLSIANPLGWEKALVPILLQATDDVNPDPHAGDAMDVRHYMKLKKIPGGRPGDTSYVSGVVFTKNLALRSMPRNIPNPRILIITFPLEYARHQQHFMSLEPVIRQEREYLQNLVHRIAALEPQLLLVQFNVSGLALEFLEKAGIATAYNVKPTVLNAVSRCSETRIITSIDKLAIKPIQTGTCASFYLKTYIHSGQKKTYMFLSGCSKRLGCTIVLRGAKSDVLAKMKRMTEFMIYVVYNLKLETCLMRDEFALCPSRTELEPHTPTRIYEDNPAQVTASANRGVESSFQGSSEHAKRSPGKVNHETSEANSGDTSDLPSDLPVPSFYSDMVSKHQTRILSASPYVRFMQPYLLMKAREQERRLVYLKRLRDQDSRESQISINEPSAEHFELIQPDMVHDSMNIASKKVREVLHAVHDAEYDKALHIYETQSKNWKTYIANNDNLFDPYAHQNIAVLYSTVCTATMIPCEGPDVLALGFYKEIEESEEFVPDCTLGQYVEQLCLDATNVCRANGCEKTLLEHHRQYVHGEAQVSVFVERFTSKIRGLEDTILMWSSCKVCGKETQTLPMSEGTWRYSFGKYLELSFWSHDLRARANICPHDLHRDYLRYFGFKDMALRVRYDPVTVLEIVVPRPRVTWKVENDLKFKNDVYRRMQERIDNFMDSVKVRIKGINIETVLPEKVEACSQELKRLEERATADHKGLVRKLQRKYMNAKHYEQIPLNRALRATQEKVVEWDKAFADFDHNFFLSERDIRRLATLQLKRIFLERDESTTSLTLTDDESVKSLENHIPSEKSINGNPPKLGPQTATLSHQRTQEVLNAAIEEEVSQSPSGPEANPTTAHRQERPSREDSGSSEISTSKADLGREDVQHLDLAMSTDLMEKIHVDAEQELQKESEGVTEDVSMKGTTEASLPANIESPSSPESKTNSPEQSKVFEPRSKDFASFETNTAHGTLVPNRRFSRKLGAHMAPPFDRSQSQPVQRISQSSAGVSSPTATGTRPFLPLGSAKPSERPSISRKSSTSRSSDKKLSDRLGINALKISNATAQSMIPRSVGSRRQHSHVSNLARHFEQLSREFEKERLRERRQRAAKSRQFRGYPMPTSKPIVEIYHDVEAAVDERDSSDERIGETSKVESDERQTHETTQGLGTNVLEDTAGNGFHEENTIAENTDVDYTDAEDVTYPSSYVGSDTDGERIKSDDEHTLVGDDQGPSLLESQTSFTPSEARSDLKLDIPKHEKTSLMKMLTAFWAERTASGWQPLEYPLHATDHLFADSDIVVREDEPSSLIAFTLDSDDYRSQLSFFSNQVSPTKEQIDEGLSADAVLNQRESQEVEAALNRATGTHLKFQFQDGSAKMICRVLFAEQFHAVRRKCGVSDRIVESLSRCLKWDSKGGKTKSVFLKTLDDRFVLKSLSPVETQTFLRFAPSYFSAITESFFHGAPSVIAKMLGFYQVVIRNPNTGVDFNWSLLVMENLFYDRSPNRIFDLKGSMRNRRLQPTGEQNEVLLDENMVEFIYETPLFAREHSKKLLRWSIYNDTLFLSRVNVMDYSLMIAIDEGRKELVVGIIDCIRTYTWDKRLESWIKDRGKNKPTVTSPKDYKNRFREAMGRYVLQAPNCWHQFGSGEIPGRLVQQGQPVRDVEKVDKIEETEGVPQKMGKIGSSGKS